MKKLILMFIGTFVLVRNYEWFQDTILNMVDYAAKSMRNADTVTEKALIMMCVVVFTIVIVRSLTDDR